MFIIVYMLSPELVESDVMNRKTMSLKEHQRTALEDIKRPLQVFLKSQSLHVWQPFHSSVC